MLAQVTSGAVLGVDAYLVRVEVDIASGLPAVNVVGLPESAVREGRERVTAALTNSGYFVPHKRITINLAPADIKKEGSAFDLPLAIGLLAATGVVPSDRLYEVCMVGELGLDGEVRPVRGVISLAIRCRQERVSTLIVPVANAREAAVVEGVRVLTAPTLLHVVRHLQGEVELNPPTVLHRGPRSEDRVPELDYADVKGQDHARRALEIAAAGQHNVLFVGPPGSGKSMLARRVSTILPPLTYPEALEVTRVYSVAGRLRPGQGLIEQRPFRAPHHTVSDAGLVGGGGLPRPGEVSLAHHGVLFLDELPEFRRHVLESLRQPLEDGVVQLGRARGALTYPARFMLLAAMNPCPCGFYGAGEARCICHAGQVQRYLSRISGPLLDRVDLHVEVAALSDRHLTDEREAECSTAIRQRVLGARERQLVRLRDRTSIFSNSQLSSRDVHRFCRIDSHGETLLRSAISRLGLSARAYHRVLRISRTIADLAGTDAIAAAHLAEAIQYRALDRSRFIAANSGPLRVRPVAAQRRKAD